MASEETVIPLKYRDTALFYLRNNFACKLALFFEELPLFFFPLPQQNKALKGKHSFLAIDIIRSQYF